MEGSLQKYISPEGEEFIVEEQATNRILNEGIPFIIVDIKEPRLTIKEDDIFVYCNRQGNIPSDNTSGLGLYTSDTRFLSCWELYLNGREPILLSTSAERDYMAHIELTNADISEGEQLKIPQETINIRRLRVLAGGLLERIRFKNYNPVRVELKVELAFFADFADMFEVRGLRRKKRGQLFQPKLDEERLTLAYLGEDEVLRRTEIEMSQAPHWHRLEANKVIFGYKLVLEPNGREVLNFKISPVIGTDKRETPGFNRAISGQRRSYEKWEQSCTIINTDNELFNSVLERGRNDIRALITSSPRGSIISAGIPWYVAPFGRDSLIAALQTLPLNQTPARDTLEILAQMQGKEINPWRDEEPGKIMHEFRQGELANIGEIPHTPYYGSVDSTPLFLLVMSEYYRWSGDEAFIRKHKKAIISALDWIDKYGDIDGDGFVEYQRKSRRGLINQGWKDSYNAIADTNGKLAKAPIALVEVQSYVYYAKKRMAQVFRDLGDEKLSSKLAQEASTLKDLFNAKFWVPEQAFYALALDGKKQQVKTITSNAGQCLWTGIADDDKAAAVARKLLDPAMFSGWGIRTASKESSIYNPMSYHNGSIWPHDNAIIVRGLKRYGWIKEAEHIAGGIFDAAIFHPYFRLPELFCGFTRRGSSSPVEYPVACSPQAWAAGAIFMILQSILGLTPNASKNLLYINNPTLPTWLNQVSLSNLRIGGSRITITFSRHEGVTSFTVPKKEGKMRIMMEE